MKKTIVDKLREDLGYGKENESKDITELKNIIKAQQRIINKLNNKYQ